MLYVRRRISKLLDQIDIVDRQELDQNLLIYEINSFSLYYCNYNLVYVCHVSTVKSIIPLAS